MGLGPADSSREANHHQLQRTYTSALGPSSGVEAMFDPTPILWPKHIDLVLTRSIRLARNLDLVQVHITP